MLNGIVDLSMEHVLLFFIATFLLYHLLGNCGCIEGLTVPLMDDKVNENQVSYMEFDFDTDNCDPTGLFRRTFTFDCKTLKAVNKNIDNVNKYIYDLYTKYKKLELDHYNYQMTNGNKVPQSICNCDVTDGDLRIDTDYNNCKKENGYICDCGYSEAIISEGDIKVKKGTCALKGNYFEPGPKKIIEKPPELPSI